jgi:hypothetical protein
MTRMEKLLRKLRTMGACQEGIDLVRKHATPEEWWATSDRGDHMLWLAGCAEVRRQDVVLAACACARLALPYVRAGDERPSVAIETAERWARGEPGVTLADVRAAAYAAASAADAADAYAADAAAASAYAAAAADAAAAYAAASAAATAYAAAYAADAADAYAADAADAAAYARTRALRECADLVRERIPWSTVDAALWPPKEIKP